MPQEAEPGRPGDVQPDPPSLTFVGTATTILRLGPFRVLTDPNFLHRGQRAYLGHGLWSKRLTEPALQPDALPDLDAVVLSHLHGDHFDRVARRGLPTELPVLTTTHAAPRLRRWGFEDARGLETWQRVELESGGRRLGVTSIPGQHAPRGAGWMTPPVMGTLLELDDGPGGGPFRVYVTGDTLCRPWLAEVTERFGHLDAMVAHLGGTRLLGVLLTMDGRQGADLVDLVRPDRVVPVHHDDYRVFRSPLDAFLTETDVRGTRSQVRTVGRGETVSLRPA